MGHDSQPINALFLMMQYYFDLHVILIYMLYMYYLFTCYTCTTLLTTIYMR